MTDGRQILHASCVAHAGRALLILGPSGSGKSSLALRMIALGARLVSDDRTELALTSPPSFRQKYPVGGAGGVKPPALPLATLTARCPSDAIRGLIEVRGLGILRADPADSVPIGLVADLGTPETERLPPFRTITLLGVSLPLVLQAQNDHFAEGLLLYLSGGRQA